jgi:hypothetical protein
VRHLGFFVALSRIAIRDLIDMVLRPRSFERVVRPGDIIASLGVSWGFPHYMDHIAEAKRRYGVRFATVVNDLIPIVNPSLVEQCTPLNSGNGSARRLCTLTCCSQSQDIRVTPCLILL